MNQSEPALWFALDVDETERKLEADATTGLDPNEAARRLSVYGPNEITPPPARSWLPVLVSQFTSPLTVILLVAAAISAGLGETVDAAVIGAILVVNAGLGFAQEWRAGQAIDALTSMMVLRTRVIRSGSSLSIDAAQLVPGDLVELDAGDRVPADVRVTASAGLLVDESALTGEPVPVHKEPAAVSADSMLAERTSLLHAGTDISVGHGLGLVVATGSATEFGQVVDLAAAADQGEIPLQRSLGSLGRTLGAVAIGIAVFTVAAGIIAGRPVGEMLITGISLAVPIVPEGLPAVVTVTLALGIQSMSRRKALLRHLEAAETLGAASVICTDKTGTLTQNRMTVRSMWTAAGMVDATDPAPIASTGPLSELLRTAQVCNHAALGDDSNGADGTGDPTELALVVVAHRFNAAVPTEPLVDEIPFDSASKAMTVITAPGDGSNMAHVKGAPEVVLDRCRRVLYPDGERPLDPGMRSALEQTQAEMMAAGLRTLAVAHRSLPSRDADPSELNDLTLLGLVGLHDPPRPEVPRAVATAGAAGITIVVMTGDAPGTALAIADDIGLPATDAVVGRELDTLADEDLLRSLDGRKVLARVTPAHKMRVVRTLQSQGAVVAMTGDGVNDAPALEQASIGIAMGLRGTDVARQASDVVLADDNFASIVAAIDEGRRQYANIRKFIRYLLSSNLGEVIAITGSVVLGWPLILLPAQILWMNLLTDGVTALALGVERAEPDAMTRPPRDPAESIVDRLGMLWIGGMGLLIGLTTLVVFRLSLGSGTGADLVRAQTLAFTTMVLMEKMNVFNFRSERQPLRALGLFSNRWLILAWTFAVAAQVGAVHLPGLSDALGTTALSLREWAMIVLIALPVLLIGELAKAGLRAGDRRESTPPAGSTPPGSPQSLLTPTTRPSRR